MCGEQTVSASDIVLLLARSGHNKKKASKEMGRALDSNAGRYPKINELVGELHQRRLGPLRLRLPFGSKDAGFKLFAAC